MENNYYFSIFNKNCQNGIYNALKNCASNFEGKPVILCIGSDIALGDSVGPLVGTILRDKYNIDAFVYGTLSKPITAKEVRYINNFMKFAHKGSPIIAVDASIGRENDVGVIRVTDSPLKPGLGTNKDLDEVGNVSIMAIVASKTLFNYQLLNLTRLNLIYKMSEIISASIRQFVSA